MTDEEDRDASELDYNAWYRAERAGANVAQEALIDLIQRRKDRDAPDSTVLALLSGAFDEVATMIGHITVPERKPVMCEFLIACVRGIFYDQPCPIGADGKPYHQP